MGYTKELGNWTMLMETLSSLHMALPGLKIAELGNQLIRGDVLGIDCNVAAKNVWESLLADYVSFDINGKDGALAVDLNEPIPPAYRGRFDIVTNCGTSEHLTNQYACFANIHALCRIGGIMWHHVPAVGSWRDHSCVTRYSLQYFAVLASVCGYTIHQLSACDCGRATSQRGTLDSILACLVKREHSFPAQARFEAIAV